MKKASSVSDFLLESSDRRPEAPALIYQDSRTTYESVCQASVNVAGWLRSNGIEESDRVAILISDPVEYVTCFFGVLMAGGIAVPLNTETSGRTLRSVLGDCGVRFCMADRTLLHYFKELDGQLPTLRFVVSSGSEPRGRLSASYQTSELAEVLESPPGPLAQRRPEDAAVVLYSSGTTGQPKGVVLSHANLVENTASILGYLQLTGSDRVMAVLPFFYSYGNSVLLTHIAVAGSLVVHRSFLYPNVILDEMQRHEVTGFSGVPSIYAVLLNRTTFCERSFPSLRYLTQSGGRMAPAVADQLRRAFPGVRVFLMYGQTEASARLSYLPPEDLERKPGSVGLPIPGVTLEILDPSGRSVPPGNTGEIVASGQNIMRGYWGRPDLTAETLREGRLWTGDLAYADEQGYLFIVGRKSDIIKTSAYRVAPQEIEEVLLEHESVHDVAVVGIPDEMLGEVIAACVVLKKGALCTEGDLVSHCKALLPSFKVPRQVQFLKDLPRTSTGKVRRHELRSRMPESPAFAGPTPSQSSPCQPVEPFEVASTPLARRQG